MKPPKILIIGYQRGGTTILRRMINSHPSVHLMSHETWLLSQGNGKPEALLGGEPCGEKIVYLGRNVQAVKDYVSQWRSLFREQAVVIHIVRHPLDCAISTMKLGWTKSMDHSLQDSRQATKVALGWKTDFTFKFEDLVLDPYSTLKELFSCCELEYSDGIVDNILAFGLTALEGSDGLKPEKAFLHRTEGVPTPPSASGVANGIETCKLINDAVNGWNKYSWPSDLLGR